MFARQWEEVAQLILPTSRNTFFYQNYNTPGPRKTQQQVDATGALALHRFCAIADSLVTPRNMQWHGLQGDDYVMKDRATRLWFENTTKLLFRHALRGEREFRGAELQQLAVARRVRQFDHVRRQVRQPLARRRRGLRYKSVPLGETFFGENHQGKVDRMIRWFRLTAYQAVQKWGREALPENLRGAARAGQPVAYNFLHCVKPRGDDYDPEALDERSLPFSSSHYVSIEGRCLMAGGKRLPRFPYAVSRYDQAPGEVEGRGPGADRAAVAEDAQREKTVFLKQGHRAADPVLLIADDGWSAWTCGRARRTRAASRPTASRWCTRCRPATSRSRKDDAGGARHHRRRVPGLAVQGAVRAPEHDRDAGDRARQRKGHAGRADARPPAHRICRRPGRARTRSAVRDAAAGTDAAAAARGDGRL
jgi:hypothetical protein